MKAVLKSFAFALFGTGVFFSFFMMLSIAAVNVTSRLHDPNAPLQAPDVVLAPAAWMRMPGLPLSAVAFVLCFWLAMKKFRKSSSQLSAISSQPKVSQP